MSGKKEHKKGGKQYQQERKRKTLEEDPVESQKLRRSEKALERQMTDQHQSPKATIVETVMSCQMLSCKGISYINFWSFSGPPHPPIGNIIERL